MPSLCYIRRQKPSFNPDTLALLCIISVNVLPCWVGNDIANTICIVARVATMPGAGINNAAVTSVSGSVPGCPHGQHGRHRALLHRRGGAAAAADRLRLRQGVSTRNGARLPAVPAGAVGVIRASRSPSATFL